MARRYNVPDFDCLSIVVDHCIEYRVVKRDDFQVLSRRVSDNQDHILQFTYVETRDVVTVTVPKLSDVTESEIKNSNKCRIGAEPN